MFVEGAIGSAHCSPNGNIPLVSLAFGQKETSPVSRGSEPPSAGRRLKFG